MQQGFGGQFYYPNYSPGRPFKYHVNFCSTSVFLCDSFFNWRSVKSHYRNRDSVTRKISQIIKYINSFFRNRYLNTWWVCLSHGNIEDLWTFHVTIIFEVMNSTYSLCNIGWQVFHSQRSLTIPACKISSGNGLIICIKDRNKKSGSLIIFIRNKKKDLVHTRRLMTQSWPDNWCNHSLKNLKPYIIVVKLLPTSTFSLKEVKKSPLSAYLGSSLLNGYERQQ